MLLYYAEPEFYWDSKVQRYRYRDSRRFVSRDAILSLTDRSIQANHLELTQLADKLASGELAIANFEREAGQILRRLHVQQAILGRGGSDRMTPANWLEVGRELKRQYYAGRGDDGKPYGLRWLAQDIRDGTVSLAMLKSRLGAFADSSRVSYWAMQRQNAIDAGKPYAKRKLNPEAEHCADCYAYAQEPPKPIALVPLPSQNCDCLTSCRCDVIFLSRDEAIAQGMPSNFAGLRWGWIG